MKKELHKIFIFIFGFLLLASAPALSQKLQFGTKATMAGTYIISGSGSFDKSSYKIVPGITTGVGILGNFYIDKKFHFNICSGIQLQIKTYSFQLYDLGVSNVNGKIVYRPEFISPEVPLIFNFEQERKKKKNSYINYQLGAILSYNIPIVLNMRQNGPFLHDGEGDTLISSFDVTTNNLRTFSPDIYAGISWIQKIKNRRTFEWGLSLQYAIKNSASYHFTGMLMTTNERKDFDNLFAAKLSYVAVHFIYYPKHWIIL